MSTRYDSSYGIAKAINAGEQENDRVVTKGALTDGQYWAVCRERNVLSAAANGHSQVFPKAQMTVRDGWAYFYRDGTEVWNCNAVYAAAQFMIQPA